MAGVRSGIWVDSNLINLKAIGLSEVRPEINKLLVGGEHPVLAFQTVRDQVIFTDKRIIVVNVQGLTGKKIAYMSYPYSKVQYFAIETAGMLDIDSELQLAFNDGLNLSFDFKTNVDIHAICTLLSSYIL